jgi:hypothetical protein
MRFVVGAKLLRRHRGWFQMPIGALCFPSQRFFGFHPFFFSYELNGLIWGLLPTNYIELFKIQDVCFLNKLGSFTRRRT